MPCSIQLMFFLDEERYRETPFFSFADSEKIGLENLMTLEGHQEAFVPLSLSFIPLIFCPTLIKAKTRVSMSHSPFCSPSDVFKSPNTAC